MASHSLREVRPQVPQAAEASRRILNSARHLAPPGSIRTVARSYRLLHEISASIDAKSAQKLTIY
jgi:hypothetical protein